MREIHEAYQQSETGRKRQNKKKEIKDEDGNIPHSSEYENIIRMIVEVIKGYLTVDEIKRENLKNDEVKTKEKMGKGSLPTKCIASRLHKKRKTKLDMKHKKCLFDRDIILDLKKINQCRKLSARKSVPRGFEAYTDDKVKDVFTNYK